jgi:phosphate transport system permease protein
VTDEPGEPETSTQAAVPEPPALDQERFVGDASVMTPGVEVRHPEVDPDGPPRHLAHPEVLSSTQAAAISTLDDEPPVVGGGSVTGSSGGRGKVRIGDRIFGGLANGSGWFIILLIALVAVFLITRAMPALTGDKENFLTSTRWLFTDPANPGSSKFEFHVGIAALLWVTIIISLEAMLIAVPISIGIALFLTYYAPKRMADTFAFVINLLAAVPSIIFGVWGITELGPALRPVQDFLYNFDFIPLFKDKTGGIYTIFVGGVVLAIMILPIVTAVSRDVFARTPRYNIEAALALGATRWEMIRMAVLPYGRPGVVSGAMLGLGRALGETIAVLLILHVPPSFSFSIMQGGQTFASKIAADAGETTSQTAPAYIAAGLVLFVLTFLVNAAARAVVNRRKDFV